MQITAFSFLLQVLSEAICQQWQGKQKGQKLQERNSLKLPWAEIANKENVEKKRKIIIELDNVNTFPSKINWKSFCKWVTVRVMGQG